MKALKILALLSSAALLAACGAGGNGGKESSKDASVDPASVQSVDSESSEAAPTYMTPEEIATAIGSNWDATPAEVQPGVYGVYGAFSAANYSVEVMKGFVSSSFVPEEFELVDDWTASDDGTESCFYINPVNTALEIYVYADTVIVDGEGKIVEESSEGTSEIEATCIEAYAYTVEAEA